MNNGGSAFPYGFNVPGEGAQWEEGMTLRDYFAAKVLGSVVSLPETYLAIKDKSISVTEIAGGCYQWADAMLKAREEK